MTGDAKVVDRLTLLLETALTNARSLVANIEDHRIALTRTHPRSLAKIDLALLPAVQDDASHAALMSGHRKLINVLKRHRETFALYQFEAVDYKGACLHLRNRYRRDVVSGLADCASQPQPEIENHLAEIHLRFEKAFQPLRARIDKTGSDVRSDIAAQRERIKDIALKSCGDLAPYLCALVALQRTTLAYPTL